MTRYFKMLSIKENSQNRYVKMKLFTFGTTHHTWPSPFYSYKRNQQKTFKKCKYLRSNITTTTGIAYKCYINIYKSE